MIPYYSNYIYIVKHNDILCTLAEDPSFGNNIYHGEQWGIFFLPEMMIPYRSNYIYICKLNDILCRLAKDLPVETISTTVSTWGIFCG